MTCPIPVPIGINPALANRKQIYNRTSGLHPLLLMLPTEKESSLFYHLAPLETTSSGTRPNGTELSAQLYTSRSLHKPTLPSLPSLRLLQRSSKGSLPPASMHKSRFRLMPQAIPSMTTTQLSPSLTSFCSTAKIASVETFSRHIWCRNPAKAPFLP